MKVYVASPVRPVLEDYAGAGPMEIVRKISLLGCETMKKLGHTPISPILAFDGIYDEYTERERIDQACEELLLSCDAIYVVKTPYNKDSKGIARELKIAKANNIPTIGA